MPEKLDSDTFYSVILFVHWIKENTVFFYCLIATWMRFAEVRWGSLSEHDWFYQLWVWSHTCYFTSGREKPRVHNRKSWLSVPLSRSFIAPTIWGREGLEIPSFRHNSRPKTLQNSIRFRLTKNVSLNAVLKVSLCRN